MYFLQGTEFEKNLRFFATCHGPSVTSLEELRTSRKILWFCPSSQGFSPQKNVWSSANWGTTIAADPRLQFNFPWWLHQLLNHWIAQKLGDYKVLWPSKLQESVPLVRCAATCCFRSFWIALVLFHLPQLSLIFRLFNATVIPAAIFLSLWIGDTTRYLVKLYICQQCGSTILIKMRYINASVLITALCLMVGSHFSSTLRRLTTLLGAAAMVVDADPRFATATSETPSREKQEPQEAASGDVSSATWWRCLRIEKY